MTDAAFELLAIVGSLNSYIGLTIVVTVPTAAFALCLVFSLVVIVRVVLAGPIPSLSLPIRFDGSNETSVV